MAACGIGEEELGTEEKNILDKMRNKKYTDKEKLKTDKNKFVDFCGNKEVEKKVKSLAKEVEAVLKTKDKKKKEELKERIKKLLSEDNIYLKKQNAAIVNLLIKLSKSDSKTSDTPNSPSNIP